MIARYRTLGARIRAELLDLERTQAAIMRHWQWAKTAADQQDAYLNSVALNLHAFYSGLERIFELVAADVDGGKPGGSEWHIELLRQMTLDLTPTRPSVLSQETWMALDEYRRFRHLIRNIYATNLKPARIEELVQNLPSLWQRLRNELERFADFLDEMSRADEEWS
jgi:hypothetical protein